MKSWIPHLQKHAGSWWYAPAVGLLAFIDHFVIVIPTDGILVSAVMLQPRKWISTCLIVSIFSSIGALVLAGTVETHGLPLLLKFAPGINESQLWTWSDGVIDRYGALALFGVALSPLMQHPAIALAAMAQMPITKIFFVVLAGRIIKYGIFCWIASHTPHLVRKLWGVQGELKEVGGTLGER